MTALVGQLAQGSDPMLDLGQSSVSTRGATQRVRLQEELASGRGLFFQGVLVNMSRRMLPSMSPETDPQALLRSGVCLSRYFERFGGWGGQRDAALIAHGRFPGREDRAGPGSHSPAGGVHGTAHDGRGSGRVGLPPDPPGGTPLLNVHPAAALGHAQDQNVYTFSKPKVGDRYSQLSSGNGDNSKSSQRNRKPASKASAHGSEGTAGETVEGNKPKKKPKKKPQPHVT